MSSSSATFVFYQDLCPGATNPNDVCNFSQMCFELASEIYCIFTQFYARDMAPNPAPAYQALITSITRHCNMTAAPISDASSLKYQISDTWGEGDLGQAEISSNHSTITPGAACIQKRFTLASHNIYEASLQSAKKAALATLAVVGGLCLFALCLALVGAAIYQCRQNNKKAANNHRAANEQPLMVQV